MLCYTETSLTSLQVVFFRVSTVIPQTEVAIIQNIRSEYFILKRVNFHVQVTQIT